MLNKYLKVEAKIPYGSQVVAFTRNYTKFLSLNGQFDLEVQSHQFSNTSEIFR